MRFTVCHAGSRPTNTPASIPLFVYGSLLHGEPNHELLAPARFLGQARTEPRYTLVDLGAYPALVEAGDTAVEGELYALDARRLALLDEFEEHPHVYRRSPVHLAGGAPAQTYLMAPQRASRGTVVACGSWRRRPRVHGAGLHGDVRA